MKRFLKKVLLLGSIAIGIYLVEYLAGCFVLGGTYEDNYCAAILDKMARLRSIEGPKIILVGNSNVAFGIDSREMERQLGMPVVNLGGHGGWGNSFHERMVDEGVSKGDCVIIMHSSYADSGGVKEFPLAWLTIEYHTELYHLIPPDCLFDMFRTYPDYLYASIKKRCGRGSYAAKGPYRRMDFDKNGDNIYPRTEVTYQFADKDARLNPEIHPACRERLDDLNRQVREKGAYLLIAGFPLHTGEFAQKEEDIRALQHNLENQLEAEVISDFMEYRFDPADFFDTNLHLNETGVRKRTQLLIDDIRRWRESHSIHEPKPEAGR